jgi:hypothetical protein
MLCISLTAQGVVRGQDNHDIPSVIKESFLKDFVNANSASWRKVDRYFAVSFVLDALRMEATYSGTGTWESTEISIPVGKMPEKVINHYRSQYGNYELVDTGYHDEVGNRFYRILIRKDGGTQMLKYDDNGIFIR